MRTALATTARLCAVVAACVASSTAVAAVQEELDPKPYAVHARPDEPLRQAINAATPITVKGQRFHGYTRWNVRWTFRWWREASGRCSITEVTTRLHVELQLPELQRTTPDQRAEFDRYLTALKLHEQGHVQVGRDAARAVDDGIAQLPAEAECATLERRANALGQRIVQDHVEREKLYDLDTAHGATQGAKLKH